VNVWYLVGAGDVQDVVTDWSYGPKSSYTAQNSGELVMPRSVSTNRTLICLQLFCSTDISMFIIIIITDYRYELTGCTTVSTLRSVSTK
jgi:hypothetical protein